MKLYVEMQDFGNVGIGGTMTSRIVVIELTPDQEDQLEQRFTHSIAGKEIYETIRPICIEGENHEH